MTQKKIAGLKPRFRKIVDFNDDTPRNRVVGKLVEMAMESIGIKDIIAASKGFALDQRLTTKEKVVVAGKRKRIKQLRAEIVAELGHLCLHERMELVVNFPLIKELVEKSIKKHPPPQTK